MFKVSNKDTRTSPKSLMFFGPRCDTMRTPLCSGHLYITETFCGTVGVRYEKVWLYLAVFGCVCSIYCNDFRIALMTLELLPTAI